MSDDALNQLGYSSYPRSLPVRVGLYAANLITLPYREAEILFDKIFNGELIGGGLRTGSFLFDRYSRVAIFTTGDIAVAIGQCSEPQS